MMKKLLTAFALFVVMAFSVSATCTELLDFEDLPAYVQVSVYEQYPGVSFSDGWHTYRISDYAPLYPGHSGNVGIYLEQVGAGTIDFDLGDVCRVGMWLTVADTPVSVEAYNDNDEMVDLATQDFNYESVDYVEVLSPSCDISYLIIHDSGNYFTVDDLEYDTVDCSGNGDVPEFTTAGAALALLGAGFAVWRKRK